MSSISLDKTWSVYDVFLPNSTSYAPTIWNIKNIFVSSGKWTVVSSSDGSANFGAVDYWTTSANCIWANAGSNHSWVVLKNLNLSSSGAGFQVCFDLSSSTIYNGTVVFSVSAGFTGGSLTARPTATDESILISNTRIFYGYSGNIHISSDGECTRWFGGSAGLCTSVYLFEKVKNAPSWWTIPVIVSGKVSNTATSIVVYTNYGASGAAYGSILSAISPFAMLMPCYYNSSWYGYFSNNYGNQPNYDGGWPVFPTYLASMEYARPGIYGCLYDFYWVAVTMPEGTYLPTDTNSKGMFCYGDFVIGSDGNRHSISS
jgi:hypothetical protein